MFEGLVHRVMVGYLRRYVKDFQKDQLKLSLWNEEVLLENVELIPEAFEYLQLPFALKQVRVGRLSIKISFWDHPIIICLEDVFASVSQRDDQEWSFDAVERREFAAKKAQLAAAELAKLSRCVCDNQAGTSFISYITAKKHVLCGLKFLSLTVKQNLVGSYGAKVAGGQVNKTVDIEGLEIYCSTSEGATDLSILDDTRSLKLWHSTTSGDDNFDCLLEPLNVSVSLVVNKAGKIDKDMPQYLIRADLTGLAMSLDEVQLEQILILLDYLSTSRLREKYGRFRPWGGHLSRKQDGWQKLWWQYAKESILSDVHKKLKKTSWRYFGQRLSYRRKYINLYKVKLGFIQQEQPIDENVLRELEQMEKESDIDDILSYRSAAEHEIREVLSNSSSSDVGVNAPRTSVDKSRNDDHSSGKSRGWLNWLSRGMLGAGGTDDSSQFSGVVSDEVVQDIYEATKFHPYVLSGGDDDANDKMYICAIKFNIGQISATLQRKKASRKFADLIVKDLVTECKFWEELVTVVCVIKTGEVVYPCKERVILQMGGLFTEKIMLGDELTPCRIQVDVLSTQGGESSINVMLQPLWITFDMEFLLNLLEFFAVLKSFEFLQQRVLLSLNGIDDVKTRLLSKAEYIFSSRKILNWHVSIIDVVVNVPWKQAISEEYYLVLELESLIYRSKSDVDTVASSIGEQSHILKQFSNSTSTNTFSMDFGVRDLYDYFDIILNNFQLKLTVPQDVQTISILEKFCASITFASCIISDNSIVKQFEVFFILSALDAKFSPAIYESFVALIAHLDTFRSKSEAGTLNQYNSHNSNEPHASCFGFSISANLKVLNFHVDLANDGPNSSELMLSLQELDIQYSHMEFEECRVCARAIKLISSSMRGEDDSHILCSSRNDIASTTGHHQHFGVDHCKEGENISDESVRSETCFLLHYKVHRSIDLVLYKCKIGFNNTDLHCHPYICGLLIGFFKRMSSYAGPIASEQSLGTKGVKQMPGFNFRRFGYSNFCETGSSESAGMSLDCFPFITICNSGSLDDLENSLRYPDWKNSFKLRDKKYRSSEFSLKKGCKTMHVPQLIYSSGMHAPQTSGNKCDTDVFDIEINFSGVRVHFHDSSCIVGTIMIPTSRSTISVRGGCMDLLCSTEGLILTSCWWTKNFQDFLWGPSLANLSPILNIRVRTGNAELSACALEVSFGIQHLYCILPPDYLAIIIGYFSLPQWSSNLYEQPISENNEQHDPQNGSCVVYKFEVLNSTLILPVEHEDVQFLKIELQQLYCSYIHASGLDAILKGIPPGNQVPLHKLAKVNNCLNIFGRDLSLSVLPCNDHEHDFMHQDTGCNVTLISQLNADVWIRLPCESSSFHESSSMSTCIMSRIGHFQLSIDDFYRLNGFKALLDVIDQFSSVGKASKCFTSDVLHFLQLRANLKGNDGSLPVPSSMMFTEVQCVGSLSIILYQSRKCSRLSEPRTRADLQFICSTSLMNETPISLDLSFPSFTLYSFNSVMLGRCSGTGSASSALHICFSKSSEGKNLINVSLPSLDIWLHVSEWNELTDLYESCATRVAQIEIMETSTKSSPKNMGDTAENVTLTSSQSSIPNADIPAYFVKEFEKQDSVNLTVKLDHIDLTIHFPIWATKSQLSGFRAAEVQEKKSQNASLNDIGGKNCKYVAVIVHSSTSELYIAGKNVKLKSILEKTSATIRICEDKNTINWPFFQISPINVVAEICSDQLELATVNLEIQCDQLDVWLSYRVLCFWYTSRFDIPEAGSSRSFFDTMDFTIQLRKASLIMSDERWSCGGPLLEILVTNCLLHAILTQNNVECLVTSDLEINYNNIHKVWWEPFFERWKFQINMIRKHEMNSLLSSTVITDIQLTSTAQLNLNITESLIECVFRTVEMVKDAWHLMGPEDAAKNQSFVGAQFTGSISEGKYAPYILQNLTSLPVTYHVFQGLVDADEVDISEMKDGKLLQPGNSVPIYANETPEELLCHYRPAQSSDRLNEKQSNGVVHHFLSIQLDGTCMPSAPISMDLVGLTYFEVNFSRASSKIEVEKTGSDSKYHIDIEERERSNNGFIVPVVCDVLMQRYSKLIQLYSTVILYNATSMTLELRFDIPFGVSPKILGPISSGQKFPLPLHLAEAGRIRWRPIGNSFLWSEVQDLSNVLAQESKIGFLRSSVCYPSHPSSDPFRCCISVQSLSVPPTKRKKHSSIHVNHTSKRPLESHDHGIDRSEKQCVHQITLCTPLVVNNYLPDSLSLTIEAGGVAHSRLLSEVQTSFHHLDPLHDLGLEFNIHGFRPSSLKFPRVETFSAMANLSGTKYLLAETISFEPDLSSGPLHVTVDKTMDVFSGAREVSIFVPFLLYNCTNMPLSISEYGLETKGSYYTIPSCYNLIEQDLFQGKKVGLSLLSSDPDLHAQALSPESSLLRSHVVIGKKNSNSSVRTSINKPLILSGLSTNFNEQIDGHKFDNQRARSNICNGDYEAIGMALRKVKGCMYSPCTISSLSEIMVSVSSCVPEYVVQNLSKSSWSEPFLLVPPSGSTTVLVPQSSSNAACVICVTSSAVTGPPAGRTHAIAFQPRYVISNACSKSLSYKQKGTNLNIPLDVGKHSHLHWTDTMRELLVSICFNEPEWQWSGSFSPDQLGDTQLKMRNYISGALHMIRVEVQNADVSFRDEKVVGSVHGNSDSGTHLILLSDDDTGFMPYRIDNFSKERLRVYQQRCETFETIIHPYTSCPYAWDEPCYPHRLAIEVPGERVVGLYALDELKEYVPVHLKSTSEKPERTLSFSVHAEGATKILSIVDSSYHILKDLKYPSPPWSPEIDNLKCEEEFLFNYRERFSLAVPHIGISLVNAYPQELLFACAKNISLDLQQSLDQQKVSFQISSLQIDNQLQKTPYPVILSFNQEYRTKSSNTTGQKAKDDGVKSKSERLQVISESSCEPVLCLAVATWRKKDISLVSFENISLRVAEFCLELDQEVILSLLDFFKTVSSRFNNKVIPFSEPTHHCLLFDVGLIDSQAYEYVKIRDNQLHRNHFTVFNMSQVSSASLPSVFPIGAPWQKIYLLARRQKKIYVEFFDLAPVKFTLSFSSAPWMLRNGVLTPGESLIRRGLMALADIEGARIHLKQLTITHQMASWESMQDILIRHYTRQLLNEIYKVFGSAGVIGNPMGFARSLGLGIRDFLSVPARSILQSPGGLIRGMAQGTTSLVSNTVYALSDTATQFSKAAHKGIVAFTFDDQSVVRMEKQQKRVASHSKGVINEVLEGLTGLLQSPIKEAEKHGLPGVLSGIALGVAGVVARPAASILEVTGKTAQSIRNRSRLYQLGPHRNRVRLPRPLSRDLPLRPYSLEEAVGTSVIMEADDGSKLKDEALVTCKSLKEGGKFVVVTERLMLIASCSSLIKVGKPEFEGVPADPEWLLESEIGLDSIIHADAMEVVVHIVGSSSDTLQRQNHQQSKNGGTKTKRWNNLTLPLFHTNLELTSKKDAEDLLQILKSAMEQGKGRGSGSGRLLHQSDII